MTRERATVRATAAVPVSQRAARQWRADAELDVNTLPQRWLTSPGGM
jgi:hypothetical protein